MRKNISGQIVGAQLVSATDGSAFTGSVTCYVTGDNGTQAAGSVGSGACTHKGNGYHSYAPAQAETNYNHVAFTFTGSGAVPVTVQLYPIPPQIYLTANSVVIGTVDTVTNGHTPTVTEFQADDVTEATADHYNGRLILFTSGNLMNQMTSITDYAAVGGIGQFTVTALTEAPANNDTFVIL